MMNKLLAGCTAAALVGAFSPAVAQIAPPPGVSQGTSVSPPLLTPHVPPVIRGPGTIGMAMDDKVLTRDQMLQHVRELFARIDTNHDGFITRDEIAAFRQKMMPAMHMGARAGDQFEQSRLERREHAVREQDRAALFDRLDTNHDGVISRQEFMAAHPQLYEQRRTNSKARMHEMHMGEMRMHGGFASHLFAMADTNHDGKVSLKEAEAAALAHFDRMDLNHDGKITPDERREAHERMRADHHPF